MATPPIRVLVAEDSATTRLFLVELLESDPRLRVIGAVADGQAAVEFMSNNSADVILMDLYMPLLDGFEATRRIMQTHPLPIVICSAVADPKEMDITFRALEVGAVACIEKPVGRDHPDFERRSARLLETVRLMAEVKVVRRVPRSRPVSFPVVTKTGLRAPAGIEAIALGASTGGPPILQTILAGLPKDFPVPILIVQHIARGFLAGMAEWLNQTTPLHVQVASHGTVPVPGHAYLAPDDFHMGLHRVAGIVLTREPPETGLRPSVSYLFRTLAEGYGPNAIGVLLTGMGRDGAEELKLMRNKGALTIAQDRETSVVHGMPGVAIELDAATHVLPADRIADVLIELIEHRSDAKELRA